MNAILNSSNLWYRSRGIQINKKGSIRYTNTSSHVHQTKALAFHRDKQCLLAMVPKLGGDVEDGGTGRGTKPI
ncbi:hypothetical protein VNO77_04959 [Canavalia gladiata]|uniref:Uncharacterized protein n=1 Tax=Canavalia gladiata TaxID=3824 RepID=A0AAN9MXI1_CANGL